MELQTLLDGTFHPGGQGSGVVDVFSDLQTNTEKNFAIWLMLSAILKNQDY